MDESGDSLVEDYKASYESYLQYLKWVEQWYKSSPCLMCGKRRETPFGALCDSCLKERSKYQHYLLWGRY